MLHAYQPPTIKKIIYTLFPCKRTAYVYYIIQLYTHTKTNIYLFVRYMLV